jgi:hypothetical protein
MVEEIQYIEFHCLSLYEIEDAKNEIQCACIKTYNVTYCNKIVQREKTWTRRGRKMGWMRVGANHIDAVLQGSTSKP